VLIITLLPVVKSKMEFCVQSRRRNIENMLHVLYSTDGDCVVADAVNISLFKMICLMDSN